MWKIFSLLTMFFSILRAFRYLLNWLVPSFIVKAVLFKIIEYIVLNFPRELKIDSFTKLKLFRTFFLLNFFPTSLKETMLREHRSNYKKWQKCVTNEIYELITKRQKLTRRSGYNYKYYRVDYSHYANHKSDTFPEFFMFWKLNSCWRKK